MKLGLFLKWWLLFVIVLVTSIISYQMGWFQEIFKKDDSYLCIVIFAVFYFMTIWCGFKTWKLSRSLSCGVMDVQRRKEIERLIEVGWFASDLCLTLGMAGTILGFIFMLTGFETFDSNNPLSVQNLLGALGRSMATALYTTIVGLVCGQLLKFQYFNLTQELNEHTGE